MTREPDAEYQYTLRRGTKLYTSDDGENSWLLAECYVMYEESKTDIIGKLDTEINGKFKLSAQHLLRCRVIGFYPVYVVGLCVTGSGWCIRSRMA